MAQVGMLGDVIFEVSSEKVLTLSNVKWSGSARWSTHDRHLQNALTEFTGIEPDKISFDIVVSWYNGIQDPQEAVNKIWEYERKGKAVPLTIGEKGYGKYRWTVTGHSSVMEYFDANGNLMHYTMTINLQEYLKA